MPRGTSINMKMNYDFYMHIPKYIVRPRYVVQNIIQH